MISFTSLISTEFDNLKRRIVKVRRNGKDDIQTAFEAVPFGVDSNPIKDMYAIYAPSTVKGEKVIIGYLNPDQLAAVGETRFFSKNSAGELQAYVWLKADGILELNGNANFAVKFNELKAGYDELKDTLNDLIGKWNAFAAAYVPGSPSAPGLPATLASQNVPASTASIDSAKNETIKTS